MCAWKVRAPALMLEVMARELSIATWNCFGMAQTALDAITATRAPHGARLRNDHVKRTLDGAHLVCVQEVMSREAETFFDALGAARVRDPNGARLWPVTVRGSGLGIAGRLPFASHTSEIFASAGAGWDRLARKGTLHVRVDLDGLEIDIINVHLQAGYDAQAVAIRARQIGELARRVEQLGSEQRLFLVCGDFNVCGLGGKGQPYTELRRALSGFEDLGAADDLPTFDPHPERNLLAHRHEPAAPCQRLDYIFMRVPRAANVQVEIGAVSRILDRPLDSAESDPLYASDHFGLAATLRIP
jgi:endonuclease/exonuclease/phosphatase family metal-dependent hydrolase